MEPKDRAQHDITYIAMGRGYVYLPEVVDSLAATSWPGGSLSTRDASF
jgi:hypothetical protein